MKQMLKSRNIQTVYADSFVAILILQCNLHAFNKGSLVGECLAEMTKAALVACWTKFCINILKKIISLFSLHSQYLKAILHPLTHSSRLNNVSRSSHIKHV